MKKMIMILSIASLVGLTSCGSGPEGTVTAVDSTVVVVDTLTVDTTAVSTTTTAAVDTTKK